MGVRYLGRRGRTGTLEVIGGGFIARLALGFEGPGVGSLTGGASGRIGSKEGPERENARLLSSSSLSARRSASERDECSRRRRVKAVDAWKSLEPVIDPDERGAWFRFAASRRAYMYESAAQVSC